MNASRPRLMPRSGERQFRQERERNRERAATVLYEFIRGDCAAISRASNGRWSERCVRFFTEVNSEKPSPIETARVFLEAVREGAGDRAADALLDWLCRESGGRYERGESLADELTCVTTAATTLTFAKASLEAATIRANADGQRTAAECAELLRLAVELGDGVERFKAALVAETRRPVRVTGGAR